MNNFNRFTVLFIFAALFLSVGCDRVPPNSEGVLITNFGQAGMDDYKLVKGRVNTMAPGTELMVVPMFEQTGDVPPLSITTNDGGVFTVDPKYIYRPIREKAREIVYNYQQFKGQDNFLDQIENNILLPRITNVYRESARTFSTDSLMRNMTIYEQMVETRLSVDLANAYFELQSVVSDLKPPATMAKSIESRNQISIQAEQTRLEIDREKAKLAIERQKAEIQVEIAKLEAQANIERAKGLTDQVLREMAIKGWIEKGCPMPQVLGSDASVLNVIDPIK